MKGRKPKPTNLKLVTGNPGKRPLNKDEPKPDPAIPSPPDFLSPDAKTEWDRVAKALYHLGLLSEIDRSVLAAHCQSYGRWAEAERLMKTGGKDGGPLPSVIKTTSGNYIKNPVLWVIDKAWDQMIKSAAEFGMTPSSRSRVTSSPPDGGSNNPFDDL